jgi:hypothetical protein
MRVIKILLVSVLCILSVCSFAQRSKIKNTGKSMYTRDRFNRNAGRVKGAKAKVVCPVFQTSRYPYHGIGFKVGDPFAITYKYYASKRLSVAADFGKPASGLYNRYFREKFDQYVVTDTFSTSDAVVQYLTHKVKRDFIGEIKVMYHIDAGKISPGLQMYIGGGWEWKTTNLEYDYTFDNGLNNTPYNFGRFSRNRSTMGPQAVIGIEYAYFQLPISAFMELEYFSDIQADQGWNRIEGGVGLRFVF